MQLAPFVRASGLFDIPHHVAPRFDIASIDDEDSHHFVPTFLPSHPLSFEQAMHKAGEDSQTLREARHLYGRMCLQVVLFPSYADPGRLA